MLKEWHLEKSSLNEDAEANHPRVVEANKCRASDGRIQQITWKKNSCHAKSIKLIHGSPPKKKNFAGVIPMCFEKSAKKCQNNVNLIPLANPTYHPPSSPFWQTHVSPPRLRAVVFPSVPRSWTFHPWMEKPSMPPVHHGGDERRSPEASRYGCHPKNRGILPPKSSILMGFSGFPLFSPSILGVFPLFLETPIWTTWKLDDKHVIN